MPDRDLQWEINSGLNVVESWNRATRSCFFGKGGDITTNRRDEQELSVLCCGSCSAPWSTSTPSCFRTGLADEGWDQALTPEDRRGLTPLFWTHLAPYGEVKLDMSSRLALGRTPRGPSAGA
ncbi:Tn3 family transposase [Cryptosporangium minutisporangium]|uniref:Tn3 transposase DDE domain-containing protein n=1 Tax=Cryptosporangium minutisporangium TaxID=113569 RepID=A0ABP6SYJ1_9ACTN